MAKGDNQTMDLASLLPVVDVDGFPVAKLFEASTKRPMKEHVDRLRALEMRPDDVILVAYGKAGTHWCWEVASMLLSGKAEYDKRTKEFGMMEAVQIEEMQSEASPRLFNTHLPFDLLPVQQVKDKKVKVIHVYRNPKDTMVSLYFHLRQIPGAEAMTFQAIEEFVFNENVPGNYISYLQGMDRFRQDNPDVQFLNISFEEMKAGPVGSVSRLSEFLGVGASPELCAKVAEATSFDRLKAADRDKQQPDLPPAQLYRKGVVGDWKNHLTVAMSERLDAIIAQLQSCDYHFRCTL